MQGRTGDTPAEIILKPGELNTPRRWHVAAPVNAEISTFPPLYRAETRHSLKKVSYPLGPCFCIHSHIAYLELL